MPFHDHMQRNRFELKYVIDERTARGVTEFIRAHLVRDRFARGELSWAYPIYSVYLDSPGLGLFQGTVEGHANRFKLRARYYDERPQSPVFLEIKRHTNDVVFKKRAAIRREAVERLLSGGPAAQPRRADLIDEGDPEAWRALAHFCELRAAIDAEPRAIVAYMREAWNAKENDDVRVTFDRRVSGSWYDASGPRSEALRVNRAWVQPAIEGAMLHSGHGIARGGGPRQTSVLEDRTAGLPHDKAVVLELKFTGCYPRWMEALAATFDLYRTCMAKYVRCVYALGPRREALRMDRMSLRERAESLQ